MLILSQDKKEIVNLDNISNMFILCNTIKCMLINGGKTYIGTYDKEERAKEVLQEIIEAYKESRVVIIDNVKAENKVVYEMPEK